MARATKTQKTTRIQREKTRIILDAALAVFSREGFRGATIDQIAEQAGMSKPNILYYFDDKPSIHAILLQGILESWLEPLEALKPDGDPVQELLAYIYRKIDLAFEFPRESRLFAFEIMRGTQDFVPILQTVLRPLVDEKTALIQTWVDDGKLAPIDPRHLLFMIWATTQHYSDFEIQIEAVMPDRERAQRFEDAKAHLTTSFTRMLQPT